MANHNKINFKISPLLLLLSMLLILTLTSCSGVSSELACTQDSDCVAATCCHATDAVNKDNAPNCQGIMCTASCEPNTMDCGQAKALCVDNTCKVVQI